MWLLPRIFELKDGELFTLFHGINGTRRVPRNEWLHARVAPVTYGKGQRIWESGFHVFAPGVKPDDYMGRFTGDRELVIVNVWVKDVWEKPTNSTVWLARSMFVPI